MTETRPTTTPLAVVDFARPERVIDEGLLAACLAKPINAETFSALISSNYLMVMDAYDHRCTRENFSDIVVLALNFQNRLVRLAEMKTMQENMLSPDYTPDAFNEEIDRHMTQAMEYQQTLRQTLRLFQEMRE